jgi:hypothetical protein
VSRITLSPAERNKRRWIRGWLDAMAQRAHPYHPQDPAKRCFYDRGREAGEIAHEKAWQEAVELYEQQEADREAAQLRGELAVRRAALKEEAKATWPHRDISSYRHIRMLVRLLGPERVREVAVELVDERSGYTMEFAPDPGQHRALYDEEEARLRGTKE